MQAKLAVRLCRHWHLDNYIWFTVFFNILPATIEVLVGIVLLRTQLRKYR